MPLVIVPQYFGSLVFDARTAAYLPFDRPATDWLVQSICTPFDLLAASAPADEREGLHRFFSHLHEQGLFTLDLRFAGTRLAITPPADHLAGPLAVHLEVADSCNLSCRHCFAGPLPRHDAALSLCELESVFRSMAQMGTFRLGLTGGEPLLRPDLFDLIDLACFYGLSPCMTTNGTLITRETARRLGQRQLLWLNISLDGACAETNDAIRGKGTFDRVLRNIAVLSEYARFSLAFTVMRTNTEELRACVELARHTGAVAAVFRPLYPVGSARLAPALMPSFADYSHALDVLASYGCGSECETYNQEVFGPRSSASRSTLIGKEGCGAANTVCSISVSGDVSPCSFLGPEFVAGNLRLQTLDQIWHESPGFQNMRCRPPALSSRPSFRGGCRARALAFNGSIDAPDPWMQAANQPS